MRERHRVTGFPVHDLGCTLKAMRKEVAQELELYGEMHRFIPAIASEQGVRIAEVVVDHRARRHGSSKYGISRTIRVILDLLLAFNIALSIIVLLVGMQVRKPLEFSVFPSILLKNY